MDYRKKTRKAGRRTISCQLLLMFLPRSGSRLLPFLCAFVFPRRLLFTTDVR
ncbi:hypothetical protein HMPREF7215_2209 [Pyramidobacter piscolens W5455]|uniref:Uncharacterized protein n=1 Tax=Pyramidobacter piscolens W5455 TaxID=352165 RepID=A0ABM9ZWX8_9BACT|nr:hypothetical protein HMPREF7215_2209 [Pyramidobacter piscolens W5455]